MPATTFDDPPEYDAGDRVVLTAALGPAWRRRAARGSRGIVVARTAERLLAVRFDDGTLEHVHPNALQPET